MAILLKIFQIFNLNMGPRSMKFRVILFWLISLPGALMAQQADIEKEYRSYVDDFIIFDFDGLASHFETPVMFIGASTQVAEDTESLKNYYRNLQSNIQAGYAYSTIDELEISQVTEVIYLLTASFTRYNAEDEILFESTSFNFFKKTQEGWKMFLMQGSGLP